MKKTTRMVNLGTMTLEQIMEMGKRIEDHGGLGLNGASLGINP